MYGIYDLVVLYLNIFTQVAVYEFCFFPFSKIGSVTQICRGTDFICHSIDAGVKTLQINMRICVDECSVLTGFLCLYFHAIFIIILCWRTGD